MLNPLQLRTLVAVVRTGSFADAARELGYAPSAVSQQISALERHTGLALFERSARSVRPTKAAEELAQRSGEVLALLETLEAETARMAAGMSGLLRIGSFPTASLHLIPFVLARLALRRPDVTVVLQEGEPSELVPLVADRRLDVALAYEYDLVARRWPRSLTWTTLLIEDLTLLLPAAHPFRDAPVRLADLRDEVWISTDDGTAGAESLHRGCALEGFVPQIHYRTNDYQVVRRLVAAGLGVAVVPSLADEASEGVVARPVSGVGARRKVLAVHRRAATNPCLEEALDACRRAAMRLVDGRAVHAPVPT